MKELSLHILDIAQNSITAKASLVFITIAESRNKDELSITIEDNGCGMSDSLLKRVTDPFTTTRTTRKVGMGIPLFKLAAEQSGGSFEIRSTPGAGTIVTARMRHSHIDRSPLGDMTGTMIGLISMNESVDFVYSHSTDEGQFALDTREAKKMLGGASLAAYDVLKWLEDYISEGLSEIGAEKY